MDSLDINRLVLAARDGNIEIRNDLIESNRGFIRRISSYIAKRNLDWSNDDELSIALMAFNEAIESFNPDRGMQFYSYCRMLINSRLIDYFRKNGSQTVPLCAVDEDSLNNIENEEAIDKYILSNEQEERAIEIRIFSNELKEYGLSIGDLTQNSPKHRDTRKQLFEVAASAAKNRDIIRNLKKTRLLPIKNIMEITGVKRKLLEQWRKYLIALMVIMSSDEYVFLKDYIDFRERKVVL